MRIHSVGLVTKESGCDWNKAWWEWRAAWWKGEGGESIEGCREVKGIGRVRMGVVVWLPEVPTGMEMGWEEEEEEEVDKLEDVGPEAFPGKGKRWCMRPSGLVVSDNGWACSEWVAAGAAGEAKAVEGVAGESSILPWEEAGLSHIFSEGRYCTHCFLLLMEKSSGKSRGRAKWIMDRQLAENLVRVPQSNGWQKWTCD